MFNIQSVSSISPYIHVHPYIHPSIHSSIHPFIHLGLGDSSNSVTIMLMDMLWACAFNIVLPQLSHNHVIKHEKIATNSSC